jgi:hypothetical protein
MPEVTPAPVAPVVAAVPAQGQPPAQKLPQQGNPADPAKGAGNVPTAEELFEIPINGKMRKFTRQQAMAELSKGVSAEEKFQQAALLRREREDWEKNLQTDPIAALKARGLSNQQIREHMEKWYKREIIDPATMTEEEKQRAAELEELERYRTDDKKKKEDAAKAQLEEFENSVRDQVQNDLIQCIEQSGLPKTRFTMHRIAYWTQQNIRKGFNAPLDVVVQQVKDEYLGVNKAAAEAHMGDPEKFVEWIVANYGEDAIKAIRKYDLKRLKTKFGESNGTAQGGEMPQGNRRTETKSMRDVDRYFNDLRRSK